MWLWWWDCRAPVFYLCLVACVTVSQHRYDWLEQAPLSSLFHFSAPPEYLLQEIMLMGGTWFFFVDLEIWWHILFQEATRVKRLEAVCGRGRDIFQHVYQWQCNPLALVCSLHGLAITDSQNPPRIPPPISWFSPTSYNSFLNCLCVTPSNARLLQDASNWIVHQELT